VPGELGAALWTETLKFRRSLLPGVTVLAMTLAGLVSGFFVFVLQDVDRARSLGLLGTKAELVGGVADWPGYFAFAAQITSIGGLCVFGILAIWVFGREFSDRTAKDLLALPTPRRSIVLAKVLLTLGWCLVLTGYLLLLTLVIGAALHLPGWSGDVARVGLGAVLLSGALTAGLTLPFGLAASIGRGYLPGVAVMFATIVGAQVIAAVGYGAWFPWSVPSLLAGAAGPSQADVGWFGIALVITVAAGSAAGIVSWWERADQR
jgi:ABC-2 type transport system permease protein